MSNETAEVTAAHAPREHVSDPHRLARIILVGERSNGCFRLRFWRDEWWRWDGTCYAAVPECDLEADITAAIKAEFDEYAATRYEQVKSVNRTLVSNVKLALGSMVLVPSGVKQSTWLGDTTRQTVLALENGLVDLDRLLADGTTNITPHTPAWFSPICLPYQYDPQADCPQWLGFLDDVLEGDAERIQLLQEWFGYCVVHDTTLQKWLS